MKVKYLPDVFIISLSVNEITAVPSTRAVDVGLILKLGLLFDEIKVMLSVDWTTLNLLSTSYNVMFVASPSFIEGRVGSRAVSKVSEPGSNV